MVKQIFVNLPVESLSRSVDFFTALGFGFDAKYTDANATCLVLGENIFAMLLVKPFFQGFTRKPLSDANASTEVITALAVDSREQVDALVAKALAAGGRVGGEARDYGFMYQHGFEDPDGHLWEVFHGSGEPA
ncbi:MAG TPA: glyoxalase [Xanthomonadaceae bacterium]|nr:glyoxalase [Xanthomonadaceae bacterium]